MGTRSAQPQMMAARFIARKLAAAEKPVLRPALRSRNQPYSGYSLALPSPDLI